MNVSFLTITFNRREGLLANLQTLFANRPNSDVWVVDNASTDDTAEAVREHFPRVRLIVLDKNIGMPARNVALRQMRSEYVVLLDDDSHPLDDAVEQSVAYMNDHRDVAAVVGRAALPDGSFEASALPSVLLGCATCLRLRAVRDVGLFAHDFFRQAEEYDLSARLWDAGHRVERFEDIAYRHNKSTGPGRSSRDVGRLDLKHNLIFAARYLPQPLAGEYWDDFAARYRLLMRASGFAEDFETTIDSAERYVSDPATCRRQRIGDSAFESLFAHRAIRRRIGRWAEAKRIKRIAIADVSKNLYATYHACQKLGIEIAAILDDRAAFAGSTYRGLPVVRSGEFVERVDGVIVANTNPGQIEAIARRIGAAFNRSPLQLWSPRYVTATESLERVAA